MGKMNNVIKNIILSFAYVGFVLMAIIMIIGAFAFIINVVTSNETTTFQCVMFIFTIILATYGTYFCVSKDYEK